MFLSYTYKYRIALNKSFSLTELWAQAGVLSFKVKIASRGCLLIANIIFFTVLEFSGKSSEILE